MIFRYRSNISTYESRVKFAEINPFSLFTTKSTTPLTGVDKGMQPQAKASIKVIGNPSYIDDKQKASLHNK